MSIVHLKNRKNGVTYVYESTGYWDKEKKQARNYRKCIGKLNNETGEIIYSKKYLESKELEAKTVPVKCKRNFYGATYLLDQISKKLGITQNLKRCFPDNYKKILSLAYYLVMEDRNPMSRFSKWSHTHKHPYGKDIPSQRSSELLGTISEHGKQTFFRLQSKRRQEEEYLAYDTTSISSYSKSLKQVKYGLNKDHDPLPQINLALLFGETSRLPVYYRKLPGNISDVKTIKNMLSDIDFLQLKKVKLVLDRGFYSKSNIDALYQKHHKFLIALKTSLKIVKQKLDEIGGIASRPFYSSKYSIYYTSFMTYWNYTERSGKKDVSIFIFL
jgi:transposase, IS4 family